MWGPMVMPGSDHVEQALVENPWKDPTPDRVYTVQWTDDPAFLSGHTVKWQAHKFFGIFPAIYRTQEWASDSARKLKDQKPSREFVVVECYHTYFRLIPTGRAFRIVLAAPVPSGA